MAIPFSDTGPSPKRLGACLRSPSPSFRPAFFPKAVSIGRGRWADLGRTKPSLRQRLYPKPLEAVGQFRAVSAFVGELAHKQGERLQVTSDPERTRIYRIESHVSDQAGGDQPGS